MNQEGTTPKAEQANPPKPAEAPAKADPMAVVMQEIEGMKKQLAAKDESIALLMRVADKAKLARLAPPVKRGSVIKVSTWTDDNGEKLVESWRMTKNVSEFRDGFLFEDQAAELKFFGEEKSLIVKYHPDFVHGIRKHNVNVKEVSHSPDEDEIFYTFEFRDKAYKISHLFVN